jgi:hypothetical protein
MRLLLPAAIVAAILVAVLHDASVSRAGDVVVPAAHFAVIRPEADESSDQPEPTADAVWLRRPRKTGRSASSPSSAKPKSLPRPSEKSTAGVAPLKRERPKSETDPPKTRRRQLGW